MTNTACLRRLGRLLAVAGLMLAVFAPVAAFAQTDYPTTPTSDPCQLKPCTPARATVQAHVVSASSGTLAFTGGNIALLVGLGLVAVVGGVVLVRVGRRAPVTR